MEQLGKYRLVRRLATGGMAEVFLAKSEGPLGFEKVVVLKRIHPLLAEDPRFVEMFLAEAKLAARLNHPQIAQVYDFGRAAGTYFIAMEYVDGPTLRAVIGRSVERGPPLPFALCARLASGVCEALEYAHTYVDPEADWQGIIHRDVSPENILLSRHGALKLVDFGIAKAAHRSQTRSVSVRGKYGYMAPEQIRGRLALDARADIYGLGVVLYELVTGHKPYDAVGEVEVMRATLHAPIVPPCDRRPDVPRTLVRILERTLAKDREHRYPSCRALQVDLERFVLDEAGSLGPVDLQRLIADLDVVPRSASGSALPAGGGALFEPGVTRTSETRFAQELPTQEASPLAEPTGERDPALTPHLPLRQDPARARRRPGTLAAVVAGALTVGALAVVGLSSPSELPPAPAEGRAVQEPPKAPSGARAGEPEAAAEPTPLTAGTKRPVVALATLRIESAPPGRVLVNGQRKGVSPLALELPPGPLRIRVTGEDPVFAKEVSVDARPGDNGTVRLEARRVPITLEVRPPCDVTLNGQPLGRSPLAPIEVYEGRHTVQLSEPGGRSVTLDLEVNAELRNVFTFDLAQF